MFTDHSTKIRIIPDIIRYILNKAMVRYSYSVFIVSFKSPTS